MKTYRVAIVGLGRMGSTIDEEVADSRALPYSIAGGCQASERLELVAGADILAEKREAFAQKWCVSSLYEDYLEMIAKEEPDMVAICTRGELHAEMSVRTAEAGVPMIFCEKAMACSMREADAVLDACKIRNVAFNTGVLRRFNNRYHLMRKLIEDGEIGQPRVAIHYAASSLLHGHIHSVDTLMYLLGDPMVESVRGELRPKSLKIEHNRLDSDPSAIYYIEFAGGIEAWTMPAGNWDFEVIGTAGAIKGMNNGVDWEIRKPVSVGKRNIFRHAPYPPSEPRSATLFCLEDIVNAYEEGRPALGNVEVTHRATEICFAVAESHCQGGTRVTLPMKNRELYIWHV